MAIVKQQVVGQRGSGGDRTAAALAVAAGDILIAVCTSQDSNTNNLPVASVKFNTTEDFTLVQGAGGSGGAGQPCRVEIWRLNAPTATTADVIADFASGINESTLTVYRLSGADATTPINGTPDFDSANGFAPAMSITTDADSCFIIGGICAESEITGYGTGQTEDSNFDDQSFENSNVSSEAGGAAGAQAHSYNMASGAPYAQVSVAIKPASAASQIKKLLGLTQATVKTINGLAIASVKKVAGVSNV